MKRDEEIKILIDYLKNEVVNVAKNYNSLLTERIIKNGKLIEGYQNELNKLNIKL